jgi:hypothetical protein
MRLFNRKYFFETFLLQLKLLLMSFFYFFNTKRLRLVEYQAENNGLGSDEMIKVLYFQNLNQKKADGEDLTKQNEQMVLTTYLQFL